MNYESPVIPFFVVAQIGAGAAAESWGLTMANYGVAIGMLAWFMYKDKQDRQERREDRVLQQKQHDENLAAQRAIEAAFRTNTNSIIVGMAATKHLDSAFTDLFNRIGEENRINGGK